MNGNETRFPKAEHDMDSPLEHGRHTGLGRVVPETDPAHRACENLTNDGEALWYEPASDDVETHGVVARIDEQTRAALGSEAREAAAVVHWYAYDQDQNEGRRSMQLLSEQELAQVRRETLSALLHDLVAADTRESSGQASTGESLEAAAQRLAGHVRSHD